jgi:hypothetical protein
MLTRTALPQIESLFQVLRALSKLYIPKLDLNQKSASIASKSIVRGPHFGHDVGVMEGGSQEKVLL